MHKTDLIVSKPKVQVHQRKLPICSLFVVARCSSADEIRSCSSVFCSKRKLPCVGVASEGARDRLIFVIPLGFERKVWGSTTADDTMEITVQSNHAINRLYMIVRWGWVVGLQEMGRATKGIKLPFIKRHIWHFDYQHIFNLRTRESELHYLFCLSMPS